MRPLAQRIIIGVAGVAAIVVACVLAVIAEDTRQWPERLRSGDLSSASSAAVSRQVERARQEAFTLLRRGGRRRDRDRDRGPSVRALPLPPANPWGGGLFGDYAARILAVDDDLRVRRALQAVLLTRAGTEVHTGLQLRQGEAEALLVDVIQHDPDPRRRSLAANWLGVILFENVLSSGSNPELLGRSLAAFETAVLYDPRNDDAKYNVEQLLTIRPESEDEKEREKEQGTEREGGEDRPGTGY